MRFFATAGVVSAFAGGLTYASEYFQAFGLSLIELDIGYFETIEYVIYLLQTPWVILVALLGLVISSVLVFGIRYVGKKAGLYFAFPMLFVFVTGASMYYGDQTAKQDVMRIINGERGSFVVCVFRAKADIRPGWRKSFYKATDERRVTKIFETEQMMYVFVVPSKPRSTTYGEYHSFHKSDISTCRVTGHQL